MSRINDQISGLKEWFHSPALRKAVPIVILIASLFLAPWQPVLTPLALVVFLVMSAVVTPGAFSVRKVLLTVFLGTLAFAALTPLIALAVIPIVHTVTSASWILLPAALLVMAGTLATLGINRWASLSRRTPAKVVTWVAVSLLVLGTGYMNFASWAVEWQMRNSIDAEVLATLPESVNDRLVPRLTAKEFIENANKDNRLTVPPPHLLATPNQEVVWQSALRYDVWYGRIFSSIARVIRVDASRTEMHADMKTGEDASFLFGDQSWVTDATFKLHHPFSQAAERVYWQKADGSWVLLISYTSSRPTITGTMVPYLAGVMEISRSGWVTNHSVKEAAELFPGAPMYPVSLARKYSEAYAKWHGGLFSRMVSQADILAISEEHSNDPTANRFPYLQHFKGLGLQEVVPLEPQGSASFALVEILFFDAGTGQARVYVVPKDLVMNGPRKAIENVRKADPNADWSHRREVEPRLVSGPDSFYWLVSVVQHVPEKPNNYAYIMSVLVNGYNLASTRVDTSDELRKLLGTDKPVKEVTGDKAPSVEAPPSAPAVKDPAVKDPGAQDPSDKDKAPATRAAPADGATSSAALMMKPVDRTLGGETLASIGAETVDIDHPPAQLTLKPSQSVDLRRFGNSNSQCTVTAHSSDGKGELFDKLPGGPVGTVCTLRTRRAGNGQIVIQNGSTSKTITVTVR